ncbi:MAG: hypothetical protein IPK67_19700 [Planctomycetes bacterium]|nr:hypothetical protein [Planctomycetota bacterium]
MSIPGFALAVTGVLLALRPRRPEDPPAWRSWTALSLVVIWGVFWALSLGPLFPGAPYTVLYGLAEPLRRFWWPIRHEAMARGRRRRWGRWPWSALLSRIRLEPARAALALIVALSGPVVMRLQGVRHKVEVTDLKVPPPVYPSLAQREGAGLIEPPPLAPELGGAQQQLIYQLYHGKMLLNGTALWVERVRPDAWDETMAENSFVSGFNAWSGASWRPRSRSAPRTSRPCAKAGFRWFSVNREMFPLPFRELTESYTTLLTVLFGQPVLRANGIKVWDTSAWKGKTEATFPEFTWPGRRPGGADPAHRGRRPVSLMFGKGRYGMSLPGEF